MDPYQVLGVSKSDDEEAIKKAYRRAVKTCHPDTHPGDQKAEEKFKELAAAYDILSNKEKRRIYDEKVDAGKTETKAPKQQKTYQASIKPEDIMKEFEQYFSVDGMNKKTPENKEQKVNPLDVSSLFEKYMGFKR